MKPLNPFFYIKSNVKKTLPMFFSVAMGVLLIYIFSLFSATTNKMISAATFDVTDKYNIVYTKDDTVLPQSFLDEISLQNQIIPVQMDVSGLPYYRGGMGGTTILTFNIFEEDVSSLLMSFNIRLVEGSLPRNDQSEILVPIEFALQNNLAVGDYMGTDVSDQYSLQGKYRICGVTQGSTLFSVTCQPGNETKEQIMSKGVMYPVNGISAAEQKQQVSCLPENVIVINRDYYEQAFSVTLNSMGMLTYIITAVMVIVLCIALGSLNNVLLANRRNELVILHSIGFTNGMLLRKLWLENLIVCVGGYFGGVALATAFVWLINVDIFIPQGKLLEMINLKGLCLAFVLPVLISVFSLLPGLSSNFRENYRHLNKKCK